MGHKLLFALVALALGCGESARSRRLPASVFFAARLSAKRTPHPPLSPPGGEGDSKDSTALVESALHRAGLKFGTDGSAGALWGYLRTSHRLVPPTEARPGDVIFFDAGGTGPAPECADHAGIVEQVDADGRIRFIEARGGIVRHSYVHPALPLVRRAPDGRVLNSFLRPKRIDEPPGARHFAGEMICAVARVTHR